MDRKQFIRLDTEHGNAHVWPHLGAAKVPFRVCATVRALLVVLVIIGVLIYRKSAIGRNVSGNLDF